MKIRAMKIQNFKRFANLSIQNIPPAKLILMIGPNGSGKSSLFDAFIMFDKIRRSQQLGWDDSYHSKSLMSHCGAENIKIELHGPISVSAFNASKGFYFRSAYRNESDFVSDATPQSTGGASDRRLRRMIDPDAVVSQNYKRLAMQIERDGQSEECGDRSIRHYNQEVIGIIRRAMQSIFPDVRLKNLDSPLASDTFRFDKGNSQGYAYKSLSGGEKAVFDLILDFVTKKHDYEDAVFCIDEPEAHISTRIQGNLLEELYKLIPDNSQLWIATHSIGMMRRARELANAAPQEVLSLDLGGHDFDKAVELTPIRTTRIFWENALKVALDDLASLVAPSMVVMCEGNPAGPVASKNAEHDARCYNTIFADEFPDVKFVSTGSANEVTSDPLRLVSVLPKLVQGVTVRRVIDRDDHAPADVAELGAKGIRVLSRRHLEAYLYDDEVLAALCESKDQASVAPSLLAAKARALAASAARNRPIDDVKSAAPSIYLAAKQLLKLVAVGNDQERFARNVLTPLVKPNMSVYKQLKHDIFG